MPELPEVETTLRGIAPHISHHTVARVVVRQPKLRWQVPADLPDVLYGQTVRECHRRAKYLIIRFDTGILLIHLGMSGSLRVFRGGAPDTGKHDHLDFIFENHTVLRYHDPRRFGAVLWFAGAAEYHPLLANLGVEPLEVDFTAQYLFDALQKQSRPIKTALMDNKVVVGVGNIYANESLFLAGILPTRPAKSLNQKECEQLSQHIKSVLQQAIAAGGSTLRDFVDSDGKSGYFQQHYTVYGRHQQPCVRCGHLIEKMIVGQRSTFYCPQCQH